MASRGSASRTPSVAWHCSTSAWQMFSKRHERMRCAPPQVIPSHGGVEWMPREVSVTMFAAEGLQQAVDVV